MDSINIDSKVVDIEFVDKSTLLFFIKNLAFSLANSAEYINKEYGIDNNLGNSLFLLCMLLDKLEF